MSSFCTEHKRFKGYCKACLADEWDITALRYMRDRIGFVMAEEGFNNSEIDDIIERLTPPIS